MKTIQTVVICAISLYIAGCGGGTPGDTFDSSGSSLKMSPGSIAVEIGQSFPLKILGGKGPYSLTSSNPSLVPVPSKVNNLNAAELTLISGMTYKNESVTISAIDSLGASVSSTLTINTVPMNVSPAALSLSSKNSQTFKINGGRPPFQIQTSNPGAITINSDLASTEKTFTIQANSTNKLISDIDVSVTDSLGTTVSSKLTVSPNTLFSSVKIAASNSATIGSIPSGEKGYATAEINNTLPAARVVTFEKLIGDFTIDGADSITGKAQINVDANHIAIATFMAKAGAPTQTGKLRITDNLTNEFTDNIIQISSAKLSASPVKLVNSSITPLCLKGMTGSVQIMGGMPPYKVTSESLAVVNVLPDTVSQSGASTALMATGECTLNGAINLQVTDATGAYVLVPFESKAQQPTIVNLASMPASFSGNLNESMVIMVKGGAEPYAVNSANPDVGQVISVSGNQVIVKAIRLGSTNIVISDAANQMIFVPFESKVNQPIVSDLSVFPASVLGILNESISIMINGGTGPYTANSANPELTQVVGVTGNQVALKALRTGTTNIVVSDVTGHMVLISVEIK